MGLARLDPNTQRFEQFKSIRGQTASLSSNRVYFVFEDSRATIWVGTQNGLDRFVPETGGFKHYRAREGLVNGKILTMQEDDKGLLWIGTERQLFRFDPQTEVFHLFDELDGLENQAFFAYAPIKHSSSGQLFFGTNKGLLSFRPDELADNPYPPPVVITKASFYSREEIQKPKQDIWINQKEAVELSHRIIMMEFDLAALNYHQSSRNQYAYRLVKSAGFLQMEKEDQWFETGTESKLRFTNLNPGNYLLEVKASNNDGLWNEVPKTLKINILPPWWQTGWAYAFYVLIAGTLIFTLYRFQLNYQLEKQEAQKLKELDAFKTRLYTNITHEFRTPLTIIAGMTDQIMAKPDLWLKKGGGMIKENTQSLLNLVNQILDLRKLEAKELRVNMIQGDVIQYLRYLAESYHSYATSKEIQLHFLSSQPSGIIMDYDPDKLLRVISNLLSNAIKYTSDGGHIYFQIDQKNENGLDWLHFQVRDTGTGIPEEEIPYIFDRFYQVDDSLTRKGEGYRNWLSPDKRNGPVDEW